MEVCMTTIEALEAAIEMLEAMAADKASMVEEWSSRLERLKATRDEFH
jgi:hypothetical protein